ncbi:hypothetical protein CCANI_05320 [Corynebacterium canis]|nr:hypothetical protein CCANI_05320 [Corynebacterium canis]
MGCAQPLTWARLSILHSGVLRRNSGRIWAKNAVSSLRTLVTTCFITLVTTCLMSLVTVCLMALDATSLMTVETILVVFVFN